jgi:hypothetical protein
MAIRINLLAEEQAAEELRRKNPVKLGIWVGSFFVVAVALWILKLQLDIGFSKKEYSRVEQTWKDKIAKYSAVTNNMAKIAEIDKRLDALDRLSTNRFFWAPVLNALQQTVINDIQVVKVSSEQRYIKEDPKTIGSGANKKTIPGDTIEKTSLYIDAKDYNPNAQNYDKFKEKLSDFDFFVKNLQRGFVLDGTLSSPTADPADLNRQFVVFKLVAHFKDVPRP